MRMFHCHMNVEQCVSRVGGMKYLFKYICQGSDCVTMEMVEEIGRYNEIEQFQAARYVSSSEAAWRILVFDIVDTTHLCTASRCTQHDITLCTLERMKRCQRPEGATN